MNKLTEGLDLLVSSVKPEFFQAGFSAKRNVKQMQNMSRVEKKTSSSPDV
jgi:hypothetical protein